MRGRLAGFLAALLSISAPALAEPLPFSAPLPAGAERALATLASDLAALGPASGLASQARAQVSVDLISLTMICAPIDPSCSDAVDRRATAMVEKVVAESDPLRATLLQDLGDAWFRIGSQTRAERLFDRSFTLRLRRLGPDPSDADLFDVGLALGSLHSLCQSMRLRGCAAREVLPRLAQVEAQLGEGPRLGVVLDQLGTGMLFNDDAESALPLLERALRIDEAARKKQGISLWSAPPMLLSAYLQRARYAEASALLERVGGNQEQQLELSISIGGESMKRQAMDILVRDTAGILTLHLLGAPRSKELAQVALGAILRRKGRTVDALAENVAKVRAKLSDDDRALLLRLQAIDAELGAAGVVRKTGAVDAEHAAALAAERETLQVRLGARSPNEQAPRVSIAQVAREIPEGAALVEILRFTPLQAIFVLPSPAGAAREPVPAGDEPARYAAYTLRRDGAITWADLGEAAPIDAAVSTLRAALASPAGDPRPAARDLHRRTMGKLLPGLGKPSQLLISADSALGLVPFGALVDEEGRYLIEQSTITYLTSGRDRLRAKEHPAPRQPPLLLGNPAFSATIVGSPAKGGERGMDLRGITFPPLPGTGTEVSTISTLLPRARVLTGAAATETAIKSLGGPGLVHLATHGFYVPDTRKDKVEDAREDPMLRAGIALAGADHGGRGGDDGILTALEASSLDLRGTRLVVLSACETGLGDASEGDGIYGLRRALVIAGAETVVTSLWRVADEATRDLMQAYYAELRRGTGRSEAMRKVELGLLRDPARAHPYFWASFIVAGEDGPIGDALEGPAMPRSERAAPGPRGCACSTAEAGSAPPPGWLGVALALGLARRARPQRPRISWARRVSAAWSWPWTRAWQRSR